MDTQTYTEEFVYLKKTDMRLKVALIRSLDLVFPQSSKLAVA